MTIRRSRRGDLSVPRMPLVALIDVVLFILLYFIMAGNLAPIEHNLSAALKTDGGSGRSSDLTPQIVSVEGSGADGVVFRLGGRVVRDQAGLVAVLGELPRAAGVVVRVSDAAPSWGAAAAVQACKDAGFTKVSYVPSRR
ncbi:MAG: hypothetical protein HRU70_13385 [Phycisphaeraceae bacterium]|nr:MAG: hypothetical protein HRU70_13385 [Phycisphaeraceae bacterium]